MTDTNFVNQIKQSKTARKLYCAFLLYIVFLISGSAIGNGQYLLEAAVNRYRFAHETSQTAQVFLSEPDKEYFRTRNGYIADVFFTDTGKRIDVAQQAFGQEEFDVLKNGGSLPIPYLTAEPQILKISDWAIQTLLWNVAIQLIALVFFASRLWKQIKMFRQPGKPI